MTPDTHDDISITQIIHGLKSGGGVSPSRETILRVIDTTSNEAGQIWTLLEYLVYHDDTSFWINVVKSKSAPSYHDYLLLKKRGYRRLKRHTRFFQYFVYFHTHYLFRHPIQYCSDMKNSVLRRIARKRYQRVAEKLYLDMREKLEPLISGKRVLILGAGPSATDLNFIPDDVVVIGINRSLALLADMSGAPEHVVWMLSWSVPSRGFWNHVLEILGDTKSPVDLFLLNYSFRDCVKKLGPSHWQPYINNTPAMKNHAFIPYDNNRFVADLGIDAKKYERKYFSSGLLILMFILLMEPAEVFLAGVDLGYAGRHAGGNAYAFSDRRFTDKNGRPLKSEQLINHSADETFLADLAGRPFPIYCVSENSKAADHVPVKPLE